MNAEGVVYLTVAVAVFGFALWRTRRMQDRVDLAVEAWAAAQGLQIVDKKYTRVTNTEPDAPARVGYLLKLRHPDGSVREAGVAALQIPFTSEYRLDVIWLDEQKS